MASKSLKLKIKKGDNVRVIAGAGKGTTGTVLEVDTARLQLKVEGHAMKTHYDRQTGITQKEGFVDYSNVTLADSSSKKATKKKPAEKKEAAPKKKAAKKKPAAKKTTKKKPATKKKATKKKAAKKKATKKKSTKKKS